MNNSELISLIKDIFKWCIQHVFKILSMPLRLIFYIRIGERQLTENLLPFWLGIALLISVGYLENSVLCPGSYPNLPFVWSLAILSIGLWVFQYWQIQYFHTLNPKKVWPTSSIGVPRFFFEPGPIPQRWTQPLLMLSVGCVVYLVSDSTAILVYFVAASFGLWADYSIIIGKQHNLYLDEMDAGLSSGELIDSSLEMNPQKSADAEESPTASVTLDNRSAFRESLRRAQALFGHVPGDPATVTKPTSIPSKQ